MIKTEKKQKKLKLGIYPYTYVRTTVMKSLLFKKEDYHKMLKMSFSEIAKMLQDSHYKNEINEFATEYSGADLLELALNKSLASSFKKLIRISPDELDAVIMAYAKRKDIEDIKTILRGKFTNTNEKLIRNSITGAGTLSLDFLYSLLKKESIEEVLKCNRIVDFSLLKNGLKYMNEKKSLIGIENSLDRYYYDSLIEFSKRLPEAGVLFRDFLFKEVEITNLLTLLRLKREKLGKDIAKEFMINLMADKKMTKLVNIDDMEQLLNALEKTEYKKAIEKGTEDFRKDGSLITLENELYKYLLKESVLLLHQHPLSIDVILGYMLAKDIEVRNLRVMIKGKQLGLNDEFIEKQLVF